MSIQRANAPIDRMVALHAVFTHIHPHTHTRKSVPPEQEIRSPNAAVNSGRTATAGAHACGERSRVSSVCEVEMTRWVFARGRRTTITLRRFCSRELSSCPRVMRVLLTTPRDDRRTASPRSTPDGNTFTTKCSENCAVQMSVAARRKQLTTKSKRCGTRYCYRLLPSALHSSAVVCDELMWTRCRL